LSTSRVETTPSNPDEAENGVAADAPEDAESSNAVDEPSSESESEADEPDNEESEADEPENEESSIDKTVFVRNLSFDADELELSRVMSPFGKVVSCKVVKNPATGLGKGTAFVQFTTTAAAKRALSAKPSTPETTPIEGKKKPDNSSTLVDPDAFIPDESNVAPILNNRQLIIIAAVDKKAAGKLKDASTESFDRRSLNLIKESSLLKFVKSYPKKVIDERESEIKDRLRLLKREQNLFISDTRLSLRHLPVSVDEKRLKAFIKTSLAASQAAKTRIAQVKIVRDANDKNHRSKGFGFVQLDDAKAALHLVRWLISDPARWAGLGVRGSNPGEHCPVVEFATEKQAVVSGRQKRIAESAMGSSQRNKRARSNQSGPTSDSKKKQPVSTRVAKPKFAPKNVNGKNQPMRARKH
jgi:nucleolar protein 4